MGGAAYLSQLGIAVAAHLLCAWDAQLKLSLGELTLVVLAVSIAKIVHSERPQQSQPYFYANRIISIATLVVCADRPDADRADRNTRIWSTCG